MIGGSPEINRSINKPLLSGFLGVFPLSSHFPTFLERPASLAVFPVEAESFCFAVLSCLVLVCVCMNAGAGPELLFLILIHDKNLQRCYFFPP